MKPETTSDVVAEMRQPSINPFGLTVLVVALALLGLALVQRFGNAEEERELLRWQNKLNLIADSRVAELDGWLSQHFKELGDVAGNPSLQIYLSTVMKPGKSESDLPAGLSDEPAQTVFLRNLLVITADRMGFATKISDAMKSIKANVTKDHRTGLAIMDMDGKMLVSTPGLGVLEAALKEKIQNSPRAKTTLMDIYKDEQTGELRLGFILPIYAIQADAKPEGQIARLVGIKTVSQDLLHLLSQPGVSEKTLEALLVRKEGENVVYLSSTNETGKTPTALPTLALSTAELDAAYAVEHPGEFALKHDGQSNRVLMTSRPLAQAPWVVLLHIDRDQALQESDNWRSNMQSLMGFALLALICIIVAAWWYGSSKRAIMLSKQAAKLAAHAVAQEKLLRVVSDNQPEPIFIADNKRIVRFANARTVDRFHVVAEDVIGKGLSSLMGVDMAKMCGDSNESVIFTHQALKRTYRTGTGLDIRTFNATHIPLDHVPVEGLEFPTPGVLVVEQDITEIVTEKERRERILHQLVNTLVKMVDARDPYSANHSQAVSLAARETAQGLNLSPLLTDTARIAGKIMNIGKILVSTDILTKKKELEKDEIQTVRESLTSSVALLQGIEFDGPVVPTLRQSSERIDGSGPLKLKGEEILITARIIAAANAFVGMISPRSHRTAMTVELATGTLLQNVDTQFDRRVVVALINFVENKKGRETLLKLVNGKPQ